jgi:WD40 repeat protein
LAVSGGPDGTIEICDLQTGRRRHTLKGHQSSVTALEFSADGRLLASVAANDSIRLWDAETGAEVGTLPLVGAPTLLGAWVAFDPNGRYVASPTTHAVLVWDLRSKKPMAKFNDHGPCGRFTADGAGLLVGSLRGFVRLCLVADIEREYARVQKTSPLPLSDFVDIKPKTNLVDGGHIDSVWGLAASPDGRSVASGGHDQTVKLWDVHQHKLVRTLSHNGPVWTVAFSADSKYLAAGSGNVKVWEVATGQEHHEFGFHEQMVTGVAFHPSRPWLASCSYDGNVVLWDLQAGKMLTVLHRFDQAVHDVAFHPAGRWLAAACKNHRVAVWDLEQAPSAPRPPDRMLEGHTSDVWSVGFSADGSYLASGAGHGVIILWDAGAWSPITTLRGGTTGIRGISFSRDGQLLAGAGYPGPTIVWDLRLVRRTLADMNLDW